MNDYFSKKRLARSIVTFLERETTPFEYILIKQSTTWVTVIESKERINEVRLTQQKAAIEEVSVKRYRNRKTVAQIMQSEERNKKRSWKIKSNTPNTERQTKRLELQETTTINITLLFLKHSGFDLHMHNCILTDVGNGNTKLALLFVKMLHVLLTSWLLFFVSFYLKSKRTDPDPWESAEIILITQL